MDARKRMILASISVLVNFVALAIAQFFLAPFVIKHAGSETLGVYAMLIQILGFLALLDLGFTRSFQRYLSQAYTQDDNTEAHALLKNSRVWFAIIDAARAVVGFSVVTFIVVTSDPGASYESLESAFAILSVWILIRGWLTIYSPALVSLQNIATNNYITMLSSISRLVISIILLSLDFGLEALVWGTVFSEIVLNIGALLIFSHRYGAIPIRPVGLSWKVLKPVVFFGWTSVPIGFASVSRFQSDGLIVGLTLGAGAASILYTTKMPVILAMNLINAIIVSATPSLYRSHAKNDRQALFNSYRTMHRYNAIMSFSVVFGLLLFHRDFVSLWVGAAQYGGFNLTIVFTVYVVIFSANTVNEQFAFSSGDISVFSRILIIEAFITIVLAYFFSIRFGISGVVLAILIASLTSSGYLWWLTLPAYNSNLWGFLIFAFGPPFLVSAGSAFITVAISIFLSSPPLVVMMTIYVALVAGLALKFVLSAEDSAALTLFAKKLITQRFP
jgi:O-antigen/teichoic acid export membrane protein